VLDIKTNIDGDLVLSKGLMVATDRERDRHILTMRALTPQGDYLPNRSLGVSLATLGKSINEDLLYRVEQDVRESVYRTLGTVSLPVIIRALPSSMESIMVVIQVEKSYPEEDGNLKIIGSLWNRNESMTALDGTEV